MTGRTVAEWVGSTPDAAIPPRVRLRVFERERGICHISGRKIQPGEPWDCDHRIALINGGEHRESNLFPALRDKHREKTAADVAEKALVARRRQKHLGIKKTSRPIFGSKASGWRIPFHGKPERRT
jgi:5-methylcytosine-specific restriction endonuclease McrA